jgi:xylulokinase
LRAETKLGDDTLVVLGGHDYICAAFAAGVMSGDKMLDINGTWEMLVGVMDDIGRLEFSEDIFYIESHVARNAYCTIESSISGDMLEWAKNVLHGSWDELGNEAAASPAGSRGCAFLPHFSGSIAPREEPASLGAFVGMSNNVTRGDMFHAVMEGLSFKTREMYDSICKAAGNSIEHFKAVGGAAANTQWMQMKADILGIPVEIPDIYEATSLGAALLAGIGSGIYASEEEALSAVSKREDLYEPDPQKHEAYRDLYENIYLKLQDALGGVNKGIFDRFIK